MEKYISFIILLCSMSQSQWLNDVRLTNDPANSVTAVNNGKCISVDGDLIHIVWYDNRNGNEEIYYKRSINSGINWSEDTRLTNSSGSSDLPIIFSYNSNVRIVWRDSRDGNTEIYYKRSNDGGLTWGSDVRITNAPFSSSVPAIFVSGLMEHIVWNDYRDDPSGLTSEIYYKRSTNGGINWSPDTRLTNAIYDSYYPSIAVSGSDVHVVWSDTRNGNNSEIYYKNSTDGGINWGSDIQLTNNSGVSVNPCIIASELIIHLVWGDSRTFNEEIYYKRSTDGGNSWGNDIELTNASGYSWGPSLISSGQFVHLVWYDDRDSYFKIYYKRSIDGGISWGPDMQLTTDNNGGSSRPSISLSGQQINVIWCDHRDGNWEIYYKRNPTGMVSIKNINFKIPQEYSLSQNFPNPFNQITKIKFGIIKTSFTQLIVYDIIGKEIASLVNEVLNPGTYEVDFNSGSLASGVFFYMFTSGVFAKTKKMVLIK